MALTAVLEFGDNSIKRYSKQYMVSDCRFVFARPFNDFRPEKMACCERVEVCVVAPGRDDLTFFEWYSSQETVNGRLLISLSSDGKIDDSDNQELVFENAHCFSLSEFYDINNSRRRLLKLGITAEEMKIDDTHFIRV